MAPIRDLSSLSDAELREELQQYSVNMGPVTASTRVFYERKLGKLMDSGGNPPPPEESEEDEEEEEEDEEIQFKVRPPVSEPKRPPVSEPKPARPAPFVAHKSEYTPVIQPRRALPTQATPGTGSKPAPPPVPARPSQKTTSSSGGGIAMWLKLLFIVFVAVLAYLVIINMNPSAENKIPASLNGGEV